MTRPHPALPRERGSEPKGRIGAAFERLRAEGRLGVVAYLTVGYPTLAATPLLVAAAASAGANAVELGIPFSDPLADGPTIQATSQVALRGGATVAAALECAAAARSNTDLPLLLMTYLNPILSYGLDRFCTAARAAGVDGLIVPDLPPGEAADLRRAAAEAAVDLVFFVAPTSSEAGIAAACEAATAFIYCIAVTGVTGARSALSADVAPLIQRIRQHTRLPIVVGFGISRREHLQALQGQADGVIVASALLDAIANAPEDAPGAVRKFLRDLRDSP